MIRAAVVADGARIVELVRASFRPELVECFPYGCEGVVAYVQEQIAQRERAANTHYAVAVKSEVVVACIELRLAPTQVFLNYIAVASDRRREGIGSHLLDRAISAISTVNHKSMALDVLEENTVAQRWYAELGFRQESSTEWWTLDLAETGAPRGWVGNLPQSSICQTKFGFSQITVSTSRGDYTVGLLGRKWFRITSIDALDDASLIATLSAVDNTRRLLALLPSGQMPSSTRAVRIASTRRLSVGLEDLRTRLVDSARDES